MTIEDAVALSLNRCPKTLGQRRSAGVVWTPVADLYDPNRPWPDGDQRYAAASRGDKVPLQSDGVKWEFPAVGHTEGSMRLAETLSDFSRGDRRLPAQPGGPRRIRLSDFARYAADRGWDMPPRIMALVNGAQQKEPEPTKTAAHMHRTWRTDLLTDLIARAVSEVGDDAARVFMLLRAWAAEKRQPLLGVTERGVKWLTAKDEPRELTLDSVRSRLSRLRQRGER